MNWELYYKILNILQDSSWHYILASITGLVVFWLILTMFYVVYLFIRKISHSTALLPQELSLSMCLVAFLYGLAFALLSHIALDLLVYYYNLPLGPPLILVR